MSAADWRELLTPEGVPYYFNASTNETTWDKPDVMKTEADAELDGDWVWAPHPTEGYVPARRIQNGDGSLKLEPEKGMTIIIPKKDAGKIEALERRSLRQLQKDLVMLDAMNTPLIMFNLRERYRKNEIYTNVGTILISCNPYKRLPLYTPQIIEEYIKRTPQHLPPHVYAIADDAYKMLITHGINQSIVISGESGAGKTECTKQALQYLAEIAGASNNNIEQRILQSNPILEAFGNAKTVRNNNSSRFGKYVEVFFDTRNTICGAKTNHYLLEKSRVVFQGDGERNYHVFFQLVAGCDEKMATKMKLLNIADYAYLSASGCTEVDGVNDAEDFQEVRKAMKDLNFKENEQENAFQIVSGVLALGNITFKSTGDRKCAVESKQSIEQASVILGVTAKNLEHVVTNRAVRVPGSQPIQVPLGADEALAARDALAKFIYERNFDWLITKLNESMKMVTPLAFAHSDRVLTHFPRDHRTLKSIRRVCIRSAFSVRAAARLLQHPHADSDNDNDSAAARAKRVTDSSCGVDIFGFEIFEKNLFEQLCINFTNEKLQQFFNQHTFKLEENVYREEKIKFDHVPYIDNQPVLDLIEKHPSGILPLIDEELIVPKGSDQTFRDKLKKEHKATKDFVLDLKSPDFFIVKHYAGDVLYNSNGFLEKNRDKLNDEAYDLLTASDFKFLASLFPKQVVPAAGAKTNTKSLGSKFRKQLNDLMTTLNATEPHYIRCIKPNPNKSPMEFIAKMCEEQLQYAGVFEAVKIRKSGFPFRFTHKGFFHHFKCCMPEQKKWSGNMVDNCKTIIKHLKQTTTEVQIGTSRVLYRAPQHRAMELIRNVAVERSTIYLQGWIRVWNAQWLLKRMKKIIPVLQAALKSRKIEQLEAALRQAETVGYEMFAIKQAARMVHVFKEEKRLEGVFKVLLNQPVHEYYSHFRDAVATADDIEAKSASANQVRAMFNKAKAEREVIEAGGREAIKTMKADDLKATLEKANKIWFDEGEVLEKIKKLLFETTEEAFVKLQLKAATALQDKQRMTKSTIRLKDLFFAQMGAMFELSKFDKLYDPTAWASKKLISFDREGLAKGFLKHTKDPIHHCLSKIDKVLDPKRIAKGLCTTMFKNILGIMGDRQYAQPNELARQLVMNCLAHPALRSEVFLQICKQLTNNPDGTSTQRGWELMLLCLNSFRPGPEFENFLELYLRNNAVPFAKYVSALHETVYAGDRKEAPSVQEIAALASKGTHTRRLAYSISVPDHDVRPQKEQFAVVERTKELPPPIEDDTPAAPEEYEVVDMKAKPVRTGPPSGRRPPPSAGQRNPNAPKAPPPAANSAARPPPTKSAAPVAAAPKPAATAAPKFGTAPSRGPAPTPGRTAPPPAARRFNAPRG